MYEAYYGLSEKPFTLLPDPGFLYMGKKHSLAYTMLEYGLESGAGFAVISGEIGSGKTTLIRHLLNRLDDSYSVGLIANTHRSFGNLMEWVAMAFGLPFQQKSKVELYHMLVENFIEQYAAGKRIVLIVDEAQNMDVETLEELRVISNINADKDQVVSVILVGQPELRQTLQRPELHQFAQRISVDYHLDKLSLPEVNRYIAHRLEKAGRTRPLFTDAAIGTIAYHSTGVPRVINGICDMALVYGYASNSPIIDDNVAKEVLRDKFKGGFLRSPSVAATA